MSQTPELVAEAVVSVPGPERVGEASVSVPGAERVGSANVSILGRERLAEVRAAVTFGTLNTFEARVNVTEPDARFRAYVDVPSPAGERVGIALVSVYA